MTNQNSYEINNEQTELENNFYKEVYDGNDKICGFWANGLLEGQAEIDYNNGDYFKYFILLYTIEGGFKKDLKLRV